MRLTRDGLLLKMREANIGVSVHYHPLHKMPLYEAIDPVVLPVTEALTPLILTLPISASMTVDDADYVCDHLINLLRQAG
ncbi:MAG: DegT/DnrJ/EryC1/StrS family aminotransferase [Bryobacteraceae bacterium]